MTPPQRKGTLQLGLALRNQKVPQQVKKEGQVVHLKYGCWVSKFQGNADKAQEKRLWN
jgi:hypothetical protein